MLKYKIKIPSTSGEIHIKVPIIMDNQMIDQSEIIERKFVDYEVNKAVNPILDYEKSKFIPYNSGGGKITQLNYEVTLLDGNTYADASFDDSDIANRSNAFKNTFIRLNFYDSDRLSSQRLLFFITLYSNIYDIEKSEGGDIDFSGATIGADEKRLRFKTVTDKIISILPKEGFNIFDYYDDVKLGQNKEVFMKGEFINAKNGKITNLMTTDSVVGIEDVVNQLHTKYTLKKNNNRGYYYEITPSFSNITENSTETTIRLFEVNVV